MTAEEYNSLSFSEKATVNFARSQGMDSIDGAIKVAKINLEIAQEALDKTVKDWKEEGAFGSSYSGIQGLKDNVEAAKASLKKFEAMKKKK